MVHRFSFWQYSTDATQPQQIPQHGCQKCLEITYMIKNISLPNFIQDHF